MGNEEDPLSLNVYTYCGNEPIMYSDPSGHTCISNGSQGDGVVAIQEMLDKLGVSKTIDYISALHDSTGGVVQTTVVNNTVVVTVVTPKPSTSSVSSNTQAVSNYISPQGTSNPIDNKPVDSREEAREAVTSASNPLSFIGAVANFVVKDVSYYANSYTNFNTNMMMLGGAS